MKFNLSQFKKLKADKRTTTLEHPDGHRIEIAHQHLSPKMRGEIEAMPMAEEYKNHKMMAEGGEVDESAPPAESSPNNAELADTNAVREAQGLAPVMSIDQLQQQAAQLPQNQELQLGQMPGQPQQVLPPVAAQAPAPAEPQDTFGVNAMNRGYQQGYQEQESGIQQQTAGERAQNTATLDPLVQAQANMAQLQKDYQDHVAKLNNERDMLVKDLNESHIDPSHFWSSRSTPQKISGIIGVLLGGMGSGILRQNDNPAMDILNKEIDRDIAAQKQGIENKKTLLDANRMQFQNEHDAMNMTRVMMLDNVANQVKITLAKTNDPLIQARGQQLLGQLHLQAAPIMGQLAMRGAVLGGTKKGIVDPAQAIRVIVPEAQQVTAFKELQDAQNMTNSRDDLLGAFDHISKINTIGNRFTSPLQTSRQVKGIRDPLIAQLAKDSAGRVTEQDVKMIGELFPGAGEDQKTINIKRQQLDNFIKQKMSFPMLNSYGIDPRGFGRMNQQGQSRIKESAPVIK